MNVYLEKKDMPERCTVCPFVNGSDECILQDDDANVDAYTWDDLYDGCPLIALEERK